MSAPAAIEARVTEAVLRASGAFWREIAGAFPEATTGDLDPGTDQALMDAMTYTAQAWATWNVPGADDEDPEDV